MKFRLSLLVVIGMFSIFPTLTFAQPSLPDYFWWPKQSHVSGYIRNGSEIFLKITRYDNDDQVKMRKETINVWDDENKKPWLLFYSLTDLASGSQEFQLFEYINGQWIHVNDFSGSKDLGNDVRDFLKNRYNVES